MVSAEFRPGASLYTERLIGALRAVGPSLLFGLRLWASVCLALYIAFWLELDTPSWAGTSAAIMCQPHLGASLRKGWYRLIGTIIGALVPIARLRGAPGASLPGRVGNSFLWLTR